MIGWSRFTLVYLLLTMAILYINLHAVATVPMNRSFSEFPSGVGEWHMLSQRRFSEGVLKVLRPTDYLYRTYAKNGLPAELYIGYHSGAKGEGGIHSPKHCLPGNGWYEAYSQRKTVTMRDKEVTMVEAVYQKGERKELFLYWFQMQGKTLADEYSLKLAEITHSLTSGRKDTAFIRISIPFEGDQADARAAGLQFVRDFFPVIETFLPS